MTLIRDVVLERLAEDLIGPYSPSEILTDYPTDVYLTGILFPQRTINSPEEEEKLAAEGGAEKSGGGDASEDEIAHSSMQKPSSFGVSFAVRSTTGEAARIRIQFEGARYMPVDPPGNPEESHAAEGEASPEPNSSGEQEAEGGQTEGKKEKTKPVWERKPVSLELDDIVVLAGRADYSFEETGPDGIRIHIRCAPWNESFLVTVMAINEFETERGQTRQETEEMTFFQTSLKVCAATESTHLVRRPIGWSAADEDSRTARLIYRNAAEYSVGHTASSRWERSEGGNIKSVCADWLPITKVPAYSSLGDALLADCARGELNPFSTQWLSETSGEALAEGLALLPKAYLSWLEMEKPRLDSLDQEMKQRALEHMDEASNVARRMEAAIELIANDENAEIAFRLANSAILAQFRWSNPSAGELIWRPFQLGFILLSLSSVMRRDHPDRQVADLLWFPTGGGKTEAYLGLIAFTLFFRRLVDGDRGAGVSAIMRYTLRLLTIQQFQRAANLICACERIRLGELLPSDIRVNLGTIPYSIGLWVGADSVPNTVQKAATALRDSEPSTPRQLTQCTCEKRTALHWSKDRNPDSIRVRCTDSNCIWSSPASNLPIWTVDEDVYREKPSLLIGTIDKFAQVARNHSTAAFFGLDGVTLPPDLIIQDELHLISGPLGTISGLYESAIDALCSRDEAIPKIIASTATIREASAQIRALFDRDTCLFPPPVIDAENSGFAVVDPLQPGRLYVGLTTAGRSAKFSLQATAASLLQSAKILFKQSDPETDWYTTLVSYFNSLRELGGALVLMQDDVFRTIDQIALRRDEDPREIFEIEELTSRVDSSEVRDILDRLEEKYSSDECIDVLLASNMLSVGVDISRFGLMVVNGQPKGMAEYIQSTSRVGRGKVPGLIVGIYNDAKVRDRSHFETFPTWHESLYRDVEATSVTPFSSRARDRALHAVLVILVRYLIQNMITNPVMSQAQRNSVIQLCQQIVDRAAAIDEDESQNVKAELEDLVDRWLNRHGLNYYWNDRNPNTSLLMSAEKAAQNRAAGRAQGVAWPTPNSMRNVEPSTVFELIEGLRGGG